MAKAKVTALERRPRSTRAATAPVLAPGLHAGTIELALKGSYRVRLATGELVKAALATGVDAALAAECLKQRRTVLVSAGPRGPIILGALQVTASESRERLRLEAKDIELCAETTISLRVGKSLVLVDEHGVIQMVGEGMTVRMAKNVRVLSANVELP